MPTVFTIWVGATPARVPMVFQARKSLTASDLPALMSDPCSRGPYRVPLAQFVMDWNRSDDPIGLILCEPNYDGTDPLVMPAIAVVVHALAVRDGAPVPGWVWRHRAGGDAALFGHNLNSRMGRWVRARAPEASLFHRVFFDASFLDKGTRRQWQPRVS